MKMDADTVWLNRFRLTGVFNDENIRTNTKRLSFRPALPHHQIYTSPE